MYHQRVTITFADQVPTEKGNRMERNTDSQQIGNTDVYWVESNAEHSEWSDSKFTMDDDGTRHARITDTVILIGKGHEMT